MVRRKKTLWKATSELSSYAPILIHLKLKRLPNIRLAFFVLNYVTYPDFWLHFIAMQFYGCNNSLQLSNSHTPGLKLNCHIFTDARTSTILQLKHQTMSNSLVRLTQTDFATRALKVHQALEFPAGETLFIKSNFFSIIPVIFKNV